MHHYEHNFSNKRDNHTGVSAVFAGRTPVCSDLEKDYDFEI